MTNVALGQKRTSERFQSMSALPPKADIGSACRDVRFVPKTDSCTAAILLLFDLPVGAAKQRKRYCRAECLSGFQMERWKRFLSTRTSSLMRCNNCAL